MRLRWRVHCSASAHGAGLSWRRFLVVTPLLRRKLYVLAVMAALFVLALATPALVFARGFDGGVKWGVECFAMGWFVVLGRQFGWLANIPLFFGAGLFLADKFRTAAALGLVAALLAMTTLTLYLDEAKLLSPAFLHPHVGFYLWVASMLTLSVGALTVRARGKL